MAKGYLPYSVDQRLLLPPDMREWLPEDHLALFVLDVVRELDLSAIKRAIEAKDPRGRAAYDPTMMVALLLYAYCVGRPSSRRIERATYEDVAFRVLAGDQHPDHDSIADFRRRHLEELGKLFFQVLRLCREAGLVKLGHIAIDGTKVKANASKHKAMSYERMCEAEKKLQDEVARLLKEAEDADQAEDTKLGKGKRDQLPEELRRRESRLKKIRDAKAALEQQAREAAKVAAAEVEKKIAERARREAETGKKPGGRGPKRIDPEQAKPKPGAQRNFTDSESRIMVDGATKAFVQGYNVQAAVDEQAQIIVAIIASQTAPDASHLVPVAKAIQANVGALAKTITADAGYFSANAVENTLFAGTTLLVPPPRKVTHAAAQRMREKLQEGTEGEALYRRRKAIVEPVFGQLKEARGFRRFLLRGLRKVAGELNLIALTHNLLKLFRRRPANALPVPA
jgi:transposase